MKTLSKNSGVTIHRRHLYSSELRMVEELDLSAYPMLAICRDMFVTQYRTGLKFTKLVNRAKRLDESVRGIYAEFLSMKKNAYVDGITKLLDMAGIKYDATFIANDEDFGIDCFSVIHITSDIGYYTHLAEWRRRNEAPLRKHEEMLKQFLVAKGSIDDNTFVYVRNNLKADELKIIENLDITENNELYPVWKIFCASCKTRNTVNRLVTRSFTTFKDSVFQVYKDNEIYLHDLRKLIEVAGIKTHEIKMYAKTDGEDIKIVDIIKITPYLGCNTFMHNELRPTNRK